MNWPRRTSFLPWAAPSNWALLSCSHLFSHHTACFLRLQAAAPPGPTLPTLLSRQSAWALTAEMLRIRLICPTNTANSPLSLTLPCCSPTACSHNFKNKTPQCAAIYSARLLSIYPVGWLARMCKVYVVTHGSLPEVELYQVYKCDCEYAGPSILSELQLSIISEVFNYDFPTQQFKLWTDRHSTGRPILL